jgi:hypothetical protein
LSSERATQNTLGAQAAVQFDQKLIDRLRWSSFSGYLHKRRLQEATVASQFGTTQRILPY